MHFAGMSTRKPGLCANNSPISWLILSLRFFEKPVPPRCKLRTYVKTGRDTCQTWASGLELLQMAMANVAKKEMQELVAVLECTDQTFLPDEWREKVSQPNGRVLLQERLVAIRQLIDENGRRFHYAKQRDLARTLTSRALLGMVVRYLHRSHFQFQAVAHVICEHSVQVFIGQLVSGQTIMEIVILVPEWISQ
jgi:hypothetical protein